jgi:glycosyltransferase involved in cell wall biosynthesis
MKILVIQETDWIKRGPHNTHHLMERLSVKGHEIRVIDYEILWNDSEDSHNLISKRKVFHNHHKIINGGNITVIRPSIVKFPVLNYISLIYTHKKEIEKQIDEFNPDLIFNVGNLLNGYVAQKLAKKNGIPTIFYVMDVIHKLVPEKYFQPFAYCIERINVKNSECVVSVNEGLREYTISMGAKEKNTHVIRTGVDFSLFNVNYDGNEIRRKYGINEDEIVLFFMGWLYPFSGLKEVAMDLTEHPDSKVRLLVLGEGELKEVLNDIKKKYRIEQKIVMVDWQPYEEVPKYLAASDICLLPAYDNRIMKYIVPIKIYEYMAMKKPVIATRLHGLVTEFGDNNGIIYIDKPTDVLNKVHDLINSQSLAKHGEKALQFVEKNNWNSISIEFEDYLLNISKTR